MPTSYMLPISKIKEGINRGIQEDRARATHGDTSLNAFFIDELGKVYSWPDRDKLPLGRDAYFDYGGKHHERFNPGAVMVHSHAAENWAHFEQMTGGIEPMTSFSVSDILYLQSMVRRNVGNTLALIHGDGRLDLLRVPELATDRLLGLDEAKIALQSSPPEDWWEIRKQKFETWADVHRRVVAGFSKRHKLVLKEGLRWKPKGKVVEPLIKRRSYYPRPQHPWYESIWEETSRPTPGTTATTKPYWMIVPGAAWPAEAKQMQLWRERPGGRARQTYKRVPWTEAERPWEEAQQMRFFGATEQKTPAELAKMELRKDKHGFHAHIDWSSGRQERTDGKMQTVYDAYYRDGQALRRPLAGRWIKQNSSPVGVPQQMRLFGALPKTKALKRASPSRLAKMELRRDLPTGTPFYIDWGDPQRMVEWYGKKYSQRRTVTVYPSYRESGDPLYYAKKAHYAARSEPMEPAALTLFGQGLGAAPPFRLTRQAWQPSFELPRPGKAKPTAAEIKQSMARHRARVKPKIRKADLSADEKKAIDAIGEGSVHIDDIGRKSGLPPYKVSAALVMLELKGLVQQTAGKQFHTKKQPSASVLSGNGFTGRITHCGIWDRDKYTGNLICRDYFTACQTTDRCLDIPEKPKSQTRVCTKFKDVRSITTAKGYVSRCAHYEALCRPVGCVTSAAPHPEPTGAFDPKEVRAVAEWMLEDVKERAKIDPKYLAREIKSRGGIKAYRKQYPGQKTDQEYMSLPLHLKSKKGLAPDEMAAEMGYGSDTELYRDIHAAYPPKTPRTPLQKQLAKQKPTWRDYEEGARDYLMERAGAGIYT